MKDLLIEKTPTTPLVDFRAGSGMLRLEGRSIPENPEMFFEPLLSWLNGYLSQPGESLKFNLKLEYVNSGTSKYLMEMFRLLKRYQDEGKEFLVNWYYEEEDESMYELGSHYKEAVNIPIRLNVLYE